MFYFKYSLLRTVIKEILYNIDGNIKEEITINSLGKKRRKFFKYNKDYNISSGIQGAASFGLVYLSTKEVNNAVVETFTVESDISGANPIVIEGVINIYNSNIAEIDKTLRLDIKTPIPYNASFESFINTSTGLFQYNQNYKDIGEIVLYDNIGNILESKMRNEEPQSYIYDYNKSYLSASVTNSSSGNVAATSFEADGNGNFNIGSPSRENTTSITGKKHYNLANGNISKTGLNSTSTFIVSYWTKNNSAFTIPGTQPGFPISGRVLNGWTYYEHKINGQTTITISGNGAIDELRLYPEKAFMTTYTYEPLIGLKSQCDVNNRITYYEYDAFNRLLLIRDQDYNILKKICYNYAGQVQDCPLLVNAAAIWSVTGKSRCQKCPIDNNYLSGLQEIQEIDTNPNSETYNTIRWILNPIPPLLPKTCRSKPDWQTTTVCEKDIIGHNTGNQIITQKDFNPCSPSGGQIIQTIVANNADCPLPDPPPYPCNIYNCSAPQYKCINGYCIAGTWCVISIVKVKNYWECSYGYSFPDGTNSGVIQIINSNTPCTPSCISTVEAKK